MTTTSAKITAAVDLITEAAAARAAAEQRLQERIERNLLGAEYTLLYVDSLAGDDETGTGREDAPVQSIERMAKLADGAVALHLRFLRGVTQTELVPLTCQALILQGWPENTERTVTQLGEAVSSPTAGGHRQMASILLRSPCTVKCSNMRFVPAAGDVSDLTFRAMLYASAGMQLVCEGGGLFPGSSQGASFAAAAGAVPLDLFTAGFALGANAPGRVIEGPGRRRGPERARLEPIPLQPHVGLTGTTRIRRSPCSTSQWRMAPAWTTSPKTKPAPPARATLRSTPPRRARAPPLVSAECRRRIVEVADETAQANMTAHASRLARKTAAQRDAEDEAFLVAYDAGLDWIAAMRAVVPALVADPDADFRADGAWPDLPDGVADVVDQF